VSGLDLKLENYQTKTTLQYQGNKDIWFKCGKIPDKTDKKSDIEILARISSPAKVIKWQGLLYKGDMLVVGFDLAGNCEVINEISIEEYLKSVLAREMNGKWPLEVLKAQAVAARTYALYTSRSRLYSEEAGKSVKQFFDMESSEKFQMSGHLYDETSNTVKASKDTFGEVLVVDDIAGKLTPAFYHSKCGGKTALPEEVWENKVAGYDQKVDCPYCERHGKKDWGYRISHDEFREMVKKISMITLSSKFTLIDKSYTDEDLEIKDQGKIYKIKKILFRKNFGREGLPGHLYRFYWYNKIIFIAGKGNGHGVGMCQFGALDLAQKGMSYRQILKYYYPGHKVVKYYHGN
jgi:stage II sporulation protein D